MTNQRKNSTPHFIRTMLHPVWTDELIDRIRGGERIPPKTLHTLKVQLTDEGAQNVATHVEEWIKTADFNQLANLLKEHRYAIACPVIFNQLFHLRRLLNWGTEEDRDEGFSPSLADGQKELLPYGAKREIEVALHNMLSAWISRMLPGYSLQPVIPPPRRGAPNRLEWYEYHELLFEFNNLLEHWEIIEGKDVASLCQKKGETYTAFCRRIAEVVQSLHLTTIYSRETYKVKPKPLTPRQEPVIKGWKDDGTRSRNVRLKPSVALSIARQSIGKKGHVQKRKLVYRLMAIHHPYLKGAESIRGHIERAE